MAGIGFRLNKLLRSDSVYERLKGMFASVFVSSGPWISTIVSIGIISLIFPISEDPTQKMIFRIIINYAYAFSLVMFGIFELGTTRYLADIIYLKQDKVIPTLFTNMILVVSIYSVIASSIFFAFATVEWNVAILGSILVTAIGIIWCSMIFLSACKDYVHISVSFFLGACVSIIAAYYFGTNMQLRMFGYLLGFTLGQIFTAFSLVYRIFADFGWGYLEPSDFVQKFKDNRSLIFIGLFYSLSIWVDKVIFWTASATSEKIAPMFYMSPMYDSGIFVAYLFVVPSMAFFMVKMETQFYMQYRKYFAFIDHRATYSLIEKQRHRLVNSVKQSMEEITIFQGILTVLCVIYARQIMDLIGMSAINTTVFRFGVIGATLHVFMLFCNILILYLDLSKKVLYNYAFFFVCNGIFAYISTQMDIRYYGLGYAIAALLGFLVSIFSLRTALDKMSFYVFMKQPLTQPEQETTSYGQVSLE